MGQSLTKIGIHRLVNEYVDLPEYGIHIYGSEIDRSHYKRLGIQPMDPEYLPGFRDSPPRIFPQYIDRPRPGLFSEIRDWGADLVLSGASTAAWVRVPWGKGCGVPIMRLFPKYDGGEFDYREEQNAQAEDWNAHDP